MECISTFHPFTSTPTTTKSALISQSPVPESLVPGKTNTGISSEEDAAASFLTNGTGTGTSSDGQRSVVGHGLVVVIIIGVLVLLMILFCLWKRKQEQDEAADAHTKADRRRQTRQTAQENPQYDAAATAKSNDAIANPTYDVGGGGGGGGSNTTINDGIATAPVGGVEGGVSNAMYDEIAEGLAYNQLGGSAAACQTNPAASDMYLEADELQPARYASAKDGNDAYQTTPPDHIMHGGYMELGSGSAKDGENFIIYGEYMELGSSSSIN
jgi:hypothetical protein